MKNEKSNRASAPSAPKALPVAHYLPAKGWWPYMHLRALHGSERQWMVNLTWWSNVIDILPLPRRHLDRYDPQGWPWNRLLAVLQPLARAHRRRQAPQPVRRRPPDAALTVA